MGRLYRPTYRDRKTGERRQSRVWRYRYYRNGVEHDVSLEVKDKRSAERIATDLEIQLDRKVAGIQGYDDTRATPLRYLFEDFVAELRRRGRTRRYVADVARRLEQLAKDASARFVGDLTPRTIALAVDAHGPSPRSRDLGRAQLGAFFRWLVRAQRWYENPVDAVTRERQVQVRRRRAYTEDELERLYSASKRDRDIAYRTAATTGLRRSELAQLTWGDVGEGAIRLRGETTKNGQDATLPLLPETVEALERLRPARPRAADRVFGRGVPIVRTLYQDLERAKIERVTPQGALDFHSFRVTFVTLLARAGVAVQHACELARHSDVRLTMEIYTRVESEDARRAADRLGAWLEERRGGGA